VNTQVIRDILELIQDKYLKDHHLRLMISIYCLFDAGKSATYDNGFIQLKNPDWMAELCYLSGFTKQTVLRLIDGLVKVNIIHVTGDIYTIHCLQTDIKGNNTVNET
jgi:hypothetical protein